MEAVQLLEESDSDYEVEVVAFGLPQLSHNSARGGHFQQMPGGGHRPPPDHERPSTRLGYGNGRGTETDSCGVMQ